MSCNTFNEWCQNAVLLGIISVSGIRKSRRVSGLEGREAGEEQSPDFWHKTNELARLSEQAHCHGK